MVTANIRISSCVSKLTYKSVIRVIEALALRKSNKKAIIAIARKMLVIVWCVLKENKPYNPNLAPICDHVKASLSIAYHQKEIERIRLLYNEVV